MLLSSLFRRLNSTSLCLFLLSLALATGVLSHRDEGVTRRCIHSTHVEKELETMQKTFNSISLETHRSANAHFRPTPSRTLLDNGDSGPLRIHVEYQMSGVAVAKQNFIKNDLVPAMKGVFLRALNVRKRVKGRLYLPRKCVSTFQGFPGYCHKFSSTCGTALHKKMLFGPGKTCIQPYDDQCIEIPGGSGVPDADFVLYITAKNDAGCAGHSETVASAGFCTHDYDNWYGLPNRPLAGVANFCPDNIYTEPEKFGYMLDTAVHEVLHALVMNKQLFEMFIDNRGKPLRTAIVQQRGSLEVRTPTVLKVAREMLGCPSMRGAKLEDEGGYGTAESHWERRLFLGEIMIGSSSTSARVVLSNLTLALLEDSGWYNAKYGNSGVLSAIEHRGCGFVNNDCRWPNKALEHTFCWNKKPAQSQPAICTPDYTAVGYCKNDISLIGECSVIQPYKNTHCTNSDHNVATDHVDLGMRNKPGARCFPVSSFKIERTENYYTVFRSDLGAVCFEVVCKGKELYFRIPATKHFKSKDIRCPSGQKIDLRKQGLGYDEGVIGPCPQNNLICESWGCPDDCNDHGICLDGKCYCDLGYVGKSCSDFACPHRKCPGTETCQESTGLCVPKGFGTRPTKPASKPQEKRPLVLPGFSEKKKRPLQPELKPKTQPSPLKTKPPSKQPKKPLFEPEEEIFGTKTKAPQRKPFPQQPEEEPFVPSTKTKKGRPSTGPITIPPPKPEKERSSTSAFSVPAENVGRAVGVGFLKGCLLFEDSKGDLKVSSRTKKQTTGKRGQWSLEDFKLKYQLVVDPSVGNCIDLFTNRPPLWRLRGFETAKTLSAISTLAALAPGGHADLESNEAETYPQRKLQFAEETPSNQRKRKSDPYAVEQAILKGLGLKDKYILQRDFLTEAYQTKDKESRRAVVYNAMISNTVIQISCYMDASKNPSFRTSDFLFRIFAHTLQSGVALDKLVYTDTVYLLVEEFVGDADNGRSSWLLSESIARMNKMAYDHLTRYSGLELLQATARLTVVSQTKLCLKAVQLKTGEMRWADYSDQTAKYALADLVREADVPNIQLVMEAGIKPSNDDIDENDQNLLTDDSNQTYMVLMHKSRVLMGVWVLSFVILIIMAMLLSRRSSQ